MGLRPNSFHVSTPKPQFARVFKLLKSTIHHRGTSAILSRGKPRSVELFCEPKPMRSSGDERRAGERFPIQMNLRYRFSRNGRVSAADASGCVVDISSSGILFSPRLCPPRDAVLMLSIDWPIRRESAPPIRLFVLGMVVRSDTRGTAIRVLRHGFEPWRDEPMPPEAPEAGTVVVEEPQAG